MTFLPQPRQIVARESVKQKLFLDKMSTVFELSLIRLAWKLDFLANITKSYQTRPLPKIEKGDMDKHYTQIWRLNVEYDVFKE